MLFSLYALNVIWASIPLLIVGIFKVIIPSRFTRNALYHVAENIAFVWIKINNFLLDTFTPIKIEINCPPIHAPKSWFLVICNHQSWVDILMIQRIFYDKIPFIKFFIKKQLIWVPLAGPVWWILDFPMLNRHSQAEIAKNPNLKNIDIEKTKEACDRFKERPTSVFNFVEGTRATKEKIKQQESPYKYLLKPKAGGVALILQSLQDQVKEIVNVTLAFPGGAGGFWDLVCGRIRKVKIDVQLLPVTPALIGDYANDPVFQEEFQNWLNNLWREKDKLLDKMLRQ
jgi:1-acyl-sn-glycerol-3-phosphate acyltransferase